MAALGFIIGWKLILFTLFAGVVIGALGIDGIADYLKEKRKVFHACVRAVFVHRVFMCGIIRKRGDNMVFVAVEMRL